VSAPTSQRPQQSLLGVAAPKKPSQQQQQQATNGPKWQKAPTLQQHPKQHSPQPSSAPSWLKPPVQQQQQRQQQEQQQGGSAPKWQKVSQEQQQQQQQQQQQGASASKLQRTTGQQQQQQKQQKQDGAVQKLQTPEQQRAGYAPPKWLKTQPSEEKEEDTSTFQKPQQLQLKQQQQQQRQKGKGATRLWRGSVGLAKGGSGKEATGMWRGSVGLEKGGEQEEKGSRKRISNQRYTGHVFAWRGKFGWIQPADEIVHEEAAKHKGQVYLHISDIMDGPRNLKKNTNVDFLVYVDHNGLGAEKCRVKGDSDTKGEAEKGAGKAGGSSSSSSSSEQPNKGAGKASSGSHAQPTNALIKGGHNKAGAGAGGPGGGGGGGGGGAWKGGYSAGAGKGGSNAVQGVHTTIQKKKSGTWSGAGAAARVNAARSGAPAASAEHPMPPHWEEHWSDEHEVPYFWNRVTKESRWIRPAK